MRDPNCFHSFYSGRVVDNHDPARAGRVRLEIPSVLGKGRRSWSPWAPTVLPPGQFASYNEGDLVMVVFREGNPRFPLVVGRITPYHGAHEASEYSDWSLPSYGPDSRDAQDHASDPWDNLDHKKAQGHSHPPFWNPVVRGFFAKLGAKLFWSEEPHNQRVELHDRLGQSLRMVGDPTSPVDPLDETRVGGSYTAPGLDDQSEVYKATGWRALLELLGVHGQKLEMRVGDLEQQEEVELGNQDPTGEHGSNLLMSNSLLSYVLRLKRWVQGRIQTLEMVLHPTVSSERYVKLKDWLGQEIEIRSDEGSPDQHIAIRSGSGEIIEIRKDKEGLQGVFVTDRKGNVIHLDAVEDVVTVSHHNGQELVMDGTDLTLKAGAGESLVKSATGWDFTTAGYVAINGKRIGVTGDLVNVPDSLPGTIMGSGGAAGGGHG